MQGEKGQGIEEKIACPQWCCKKNVDTYAMIYLAAIVLLQLASHSCFFYGQKMSGQFESIVYLIYFTSLP